MDFKETGSAVTQLEGDLKTFARIREKGEKPRAVFVAVHGGMAHCGD